MNADLILAGIDCAVFDPSLVASLRKLLVGLAVSGNLRTAAASTLAPLSAGMPSPDSLPIEPSELPVAGMAADRFVRLGSIAEVKKGDTGIQKAKPGKFPLVVTAQQRATTDHYDFEGPSAIVPLVSSTGHGKASLHRLHYQDGQYAVGNILAAIFPLRNSGITARFLYEYLSAFKDELLVTRMTGTANVALTIGKLKEVPIPIVSPSCQQVVDELMALCDRLEATQAEREARRDRLVSASLARVTEPDSDDAIPATAPARFHLDHFAHLTTRPEHVKQLRQTILNLAVRGRLVSRNPHDETASLLIKEIKSDASDSRKRPNSGPPEPVPTHHSLPAGWAAVTLGEITRIRTGKLDANAAVVDGRYPFFTCSQTPLRIDSFSFDTAAVLLAGNGDFNLKSYTGKFDAYQRTYVIEPIRWNLSYCFIVLRAQISEITCNQRGSAIPYLKLGDITNLPVLLPPLAEQRRIVAKVDELMALCDQLEASLASAATGQARLLEALLHEALEPAA